MDRKEQVTQWVLNKIGKVLDEDIKLKIVEENSSFDVETYVNYLIDKYFNENEIANFKKSLNTSSYNDLYYLESENSSEEQNSIQNSIELESTEYQTFPVEEIIKNLENNSEEVRIKFLRVLELSAEDLISQNFLNKILHVLGKNLNKTENNEILGLVLKVYQKFLKCPKNPLTISKVFTFIAELLANQIDMVNLKVNNEFVKIYDIKEETWLCENKSSSLERLQFESSKSSHSVNPEILIKLMSLLLDCQQQIRTKGMRFNETKYREIIFSFIHLLSYTTATSENIKLSGLELVSVLDPKASWCKYWCHTAVGRTLLCSALRKYKNFFIHIIEVLLKHMKTRRRNRLPSVDKNISLRKNSQKFQLGVTEAVKPLKKNLNIEDPAEKEKFSGKKKFLNSKYITPVSNESKENNFKINQGLNKTVQDDQEWIIKGIPKKIVNEAIFFHSVSLVSCLIQFRSGRALFPVQTAIKKRLLNVQDLSLSMIDHLENFDYTFGKVKIEYTSAYQAKVLEILNDLKKLKPHINSSRLNSDR